MRLNAPESLASVHARDEPSDAIEQRPGLEPIPVLARFAIALLAGQYKYFPFTPGHHFEEGLDLYMYIYTGYTECTNTIVICQ